MQATDIRRVRWMSAATWLVLAMFTAFFVPACGSSDGKPAKAIVIDSDAGMESDATDGNGDTSEDAPDGCCSGRQCGIDPNCNQRCGNCPSGELCGEDGSCMETSPNAPRILDFSSNVNTLTPSQSARISIVVTDPNGIEDVIGGSMKSPNGASYGSFQTESSEGAYEILITWEDVTSIEDVQFGIDGGTLELVAEFFDQDGNIGRETKTLELACDDPQSQAACEVDTCINVLESEEHCGDCGNPIEVTDGQCEDGAFTCAENFMHCPEQNLCAFRFDPYNCGDCGVNCETIIDSSVGPDTRRKFMDLTPVCSQRGPICETVVETSTVQTCDNACGALTCEGATAIYRSAGGGEVMEGVLCDELAEDSVTRNSFEYLFSRMECRCEGI